MPRILLLIILFWILYVVVKRLIAKSASKHTSTDKAKDSEKIVACSQCGLHIPENESHIVNKLVYCNNPECRNQEK